MSTARIFLMSRRRELRTTWFLSTERQTLVKLLRAHMANRVGSEHQSPSRAPIRLVGSVLLLGTLLAWWGTRDHRRLFGDLPRKPGCRSRLCRFPQSCVLQLRKKPQEPYTARASRDASHSKGI